MSLFSKMSLRASAGLLTMGLTTMAFAQSSPGGQPSAQAQRIRGEIVSVNSDQMTVHRNSGDTVTVTLGNDVRIGAVKRIALSDIKPGSFVGAAAMTGVDGKLTATEVHVFDESARGTGEGHRAYDLGSNSTMTNGNVGSVVQANDGRVLKVSYHGGTQTIAVPSNVPVVRFISASRSDLIAGKKVIVTTTGGSPLAASRILVEKDGVVPPM